MIIEKKQYLTHSLVNAFVYPTKYLIKMIFKIIIPYDYFKRNKYRAIDINSSYSTYRRDLPMLVTDKNEKIKCTSCNLCSIACPTDCIEIELGKNTNIIKGEIPSTFNFHMNQCLFCLICQDICPVDAISFANNDYSVLREDGVNILI